MQHRGQQRSVVDGPFVECDTSPEFEDYLRDAWPKALAVLSELCEAGPDAV